MSGDAVWKGDLRGARVAVVGASGAVGKELVEILIDAGHPLELVDVYARRAGPLSIRGRSLAMRAFDAERGVDGLGACDVAFLCTPNEASRVLAPALARAGVPTIDLSSEFRMHPEVPLVVPEINAEALDGAQRLVANPNCTTAIGALPLARVEALFGLEEVIVASYQAASGAGAAGLAALDAEIAAVARGDAAARAEGSPFAAPLALNVIPGIASIGADGWSGEELKIEGETRRILGRATLLVEATTVRVPVARCHSVAVHVRTRDEVDLERLRDDLSRAPGIELSSEPHGPRPRECAGRDPVCVGRLRTGRRGTRSLCFFAVGDQLRKGAALNALQIASVWKAVDGRRSR